MKNIRPGDPRPSRAPARRPEAAGASPQGFHVVLAIAFVVLLILKIAIVRVYRNFLKHAPVLGMMIFILAVIVFAISAGFTVVMKIFYPFVACLSEARGTS